MTKAALVALCALGMALGGCARWTPEQGSPLELTSACPMKRAPLVSEFPADGLHGAYHFVVQDASTDDKAAFLGEISKHGFGLVPMTFNINGKDTLFAQGPGLLKSQADVDAEFELACSIRHGPIELTNVRYNTTDGKDATVQLR